MLPRVCLLAVTTSACSHTITPPFAKETCEHGLLQSPIDLHAVAERGAHQLRFDYRPDTFRLLLREPALRIGGLTLLACLGYALAHGAGWARDETARLAIVQHDIEKTVAEKRDEVAAIEAGRLDQKEHPLRRQSARLPHGRDAAPAAALGARHRPARPLRWRRRDLALGA